MGKNVGNLDRALRVALGLGLIAFGFYGPAPWRWAGLAGPVLIATAAFGFCPAYWVMRIRTLRRPIET